MDDHSLILIKRRNPPYQNAWALPGGFVEYGETLEEAVIREAKEETGLEINVKGILGVYSDPNRDPRGHMVSVCFMAIPTGGIMKADTDAEEVKNFPLKTVLKMNLAFDHNKIIEDANKLFNITRRT
jgi:8-oxo-dGTP diphosphatase